MLLLSIISVAVGEKLGLPWPALLEMRNNPRYNPALVDEVLHEVDRMVLAARK